jgi:peptidoglycan/xylan/chitin deacetylase (PgdA/CDA1 family)
MARAGAVAAVALASLALVAGVRGVGADIEPPATGIHLHVPVLVYHRIAPFAEAGDSAPGMVTPPRLFADQMRALRGAGWRSITARTLSDYLAAGRQPPLSTLVVTIDDGWDDGYEYAGPILRHNLLVGTFFVVPGRIGTGGALTPQHVRALAASGHEIANHTLNHVDLRLEPGARLVEEIEGGASSVAGITGQRPVSLAYPFGHTDGRVRLTIAACRSIRIAFTTRAGVGETWAGRFQVPRLSAGGMKPAELLALLRPYR